MKLMLKKKEFSPCSQHQILLLPLQESNPNVNTDTSYIEYNTHKLSNIINFNRPLMAGREGFGSHTRHKVNIPSLTCPVSAPPRFLLGLIACELNTGSASIDKRTQPLLLGLTLS